jgi:transcriptional regulator with XRE-family HTH domain
MLNSTITGSAVVNLGPNIGYRPEDRDRYERLLSFFNVSKRILKRRTELGLSQDTLGRMAGSKQAKISEIELMKGNPRFQTLDRIARELGLVIDLVPIEQSLKGSPFERTAHRSTILVSAMTFRSNASAKDHLVAAGHASDERYGFAVPVPWVPPSLGRAQ